LDGLARGGGKSAHVIGVGLRGVLGVLALAVERIFGDGGSEQAALAVDERDADVQRAKINSGYDGHATSPLEKSA
jgi:hypothetical protein